MLGCSSASSDCSMELRQLGSYHHALRRTVANRRRPTMPPPPPPSNMGLDDKINPLSSRCDPPSLDQQEEFHGFTDLDVSAASERAEILRDQGDLLKHDIAEARGAYKFGSPASVQWTFCKTEKKASSKRKKGALSIIEAKRRSIERRYSTEK